MQRFEHDCARGNDASPLVDGPSTQPEHVPLILRIACLTRAQRRCLERAGCACTPISGQIGISFWVTFSPFTVRQPVPRPDDARRVNRDFRIILESGDILEETALPSRESVLFFAPILPRQKRHPGRSVHLARRARYQGRRRRR